MALGGQKFKSILALNVLEHTFEPVRVLDNLVAVLDSGGVLVAITPTVWPLHYYPMDCWRLNPQFYEEYCLRRELTLLREYFEYVGYHCVGGKPGGSGGHDLPHPASNPWQKLKSRIVHRIFNTYGRGMAFPSHVATGVVMKKT